MFTRIQRCCSDVAIVLWGVGSLIAVSDVKATTAGETFLVVPQREYLSTDFNDPQQCERWHFHRDWSVDDGILKHHASQDTSRVFVKKPEYKNAIIRVRFRRGTTEDLRLMTGAGGPYNTVIHIRPDHFFVQTAKDFRGPWFSYRHDECAFEFQEDEWYSITVEFSGDQVVAYLDDTHLIYAKHPMIDQQRTYFAFQADTHAAAFDDVSIEHATAHPDAARGLERIRQLSGRHPVTRSDEEAFAIRKSNAHESFYQQDKAYRDLVVRVDQLDQKLATTFPIAFGSHKAFKKKLAAEKKKLNSKDSPYRTKLHATHEANRAITEWLLAQAPGSKELPQSQKDRRIEELRRKHARDADYLKLKSAAEDAQQQLEQAFPRFFVKDDEFTRRREQRRDEIKSDEVYLQLKSERASLWRSQQAYLLEHDPELARLSELVR